MGIRGPLLVYLTQSLKNHAARPAVGNTVGDSFRVRRGLVQGCPLSPLLFNLFIDDLFRDAAGVEVPAGQRGGGAALSIADLKYADDVVALASSRADLQTRLDTVGQWCLDNGMQLGAAKCGVMVVGKSERATRGRHARLVEASERWCIVDGAWRGPSPLVPVVERYTYLGVEINGSLDLKASARARAAKAQRVANMLSPVLRDRRIPRPERVLVAKAFLVPVVMYGAELWGGRRDVVRPLELLLNRVWCMVLGVPRTSSLFCARHAARTRSARAASFMASARAMAKWRAMKSWVGAFVTAPFRRRAGAGAWVWSQSVSRSLRAVDRTGATTAAVLAGEVAVAKRKAAAAAERAEVKADRSAHGSWWREYDLDGTVSEARMLAVAGAGELVSNWALRHVDRMRAGVFNTTQRLARCGFVPERWRAQCPYCLQGVPEDLAHFLLECPEWSEARKKFIMPVLRRADCSAWLGVADRRLDLVYILLGGKRGKRSALSLARRAKDKAEKAKAKADKAAAGGGEGVVAGVVAGVVDVAAVGAGGLGAGGHGVRARCGWARPWGSGQEPLLLWPELPGRARSLPGGGVVRPHRPGAPPEPTPPHRWHGRAGCSWWASSSVRFFVNGHITSRRIWRLVPAATVGMTTVVAPTVGR